MNREREMNTIFVNNCRERERERERVTEERGERWKTIFVHLPTQYLASSTLFPSTIY